MHRHRPFLVALLLLSACSSESNGPAAPPAATPTATVTETMAAATPTPSPSPTAEATATGCGGFGGGLCGPGSVCVDDLSDDCDASAVPECPGQCLDTSAATACGGFGGGGCDAGFACADDLSDDCLPAAGGDCAGFCRPAPPREDYSCDLRQVTCRVPQPVCPAGSTAAVIDGCYGPCIPLQRCLCAADPECPDEAFCDAGERCAPDPLPAPDCPAGSACAAAPNAEGTCTAACVPQSFEMRCRGEVVHSLCFREPLPPPAQSGVFPGGLLFTPGETGDLAVLGECYDFDFLITNPTTTPVAASIQADASAPYWQLDGSSFPNPGELILAAGEALPLSVRACAAVASVFDTDHWRALSVTVNGGQVGFPLPIAFGDGEQIACGGATFPPTWYFAQFERYDTARCCGDVFFPGAQCCTSAECGGGACVDGKCVAPVGGAAWVTTPLLGRQRVLVALSDMPFPAGTDPCESAFPRLADELELAAIEGWFADVTQRRVGQVPFVFDWYVLAGLDSRDFIRDGNYGAEAFTAALEDHLRSLGCIDGFTHDFDRIILASPFFDIPSSGIVFGPGRIAVRGTSPHHLLTHELGHTFGADDLYYDVGGLLQYRPDLMALNRGGVEEPQDGVLWGQIGLADVNGDRVIDLFEHAVEPDTLIVGSASADITLHGLQVGVTLAALEDGAVRRVPAQRFRIALPAFGVERETFGVGIAIFAADEVDLDEIRRAGEVHVLVRGEYWFTAAGGARKRLGLEDERRVALSPEGTIVASGVDSDARAHQCLHGFAETVDAEVEHRE